MRQSPNVVVLTVLLVGFAASPVWALPHLDRATPEVSSIDLSVLPFENADDAEYAIAFTCPGGAEDGDASAQTVRATCPYRVLDDADALGSISLVVNPRLPQDMAIATLHGGGEVDGPTARSRDQGTTGAGLFSVFTSDDGGFNWQDQPSRDVYPPDRDAFTYGEHLSIAMDLEGHLYGAGLYSSRGGEANPWDHRLMTWKWDTVQHPISWSQAFVELEPLDRPVRIEWVDLTYLPPADSELFDEPPREEPAGGYPWANNTTAPPPEQGANSTGGYEEAIVATWLETAAAPNATLDGKVSRLRAAWTSVYNTDYWEELPVNMTVGPCSSISNGVAWDDAVYVACVIGDEEAYNHRRTPTTGEIDLWRIVPNAKRAELVSHVPLQGGNPRLAASSDGRFALATIERLSNEDIRVGVAFGWFGDKWSITLMPNTIQTEATNKVEVRIQDMVLRRDSRMLHLVYQEVYPPVGFNLTDPGPPHVAQFNKRLVAISECGNVELNQDLLVGLVHQYSPVTESGLDFSLFNDLVDGLTVIPDGRGGHREFLAYGDMGVVGFTELVEQNPPGCPIPPAPGLAGSQPAIPAAEAALSQSSTLSGSQVGLAVGGGILSLLMAVRLLAARNKRELEAPARGGRK